MIQQAVILAAGRGTRLGTLTKDRPKSMLPVLGRPIIARVMDRLHEAGIKRFVVVVGQEEGGAASYLSGSWHPNAEVQFAIQAIPTGTVDALLMAAPYLTGPFLLTAVDNITSAQHVHNLIACFDRHPDQLAALSLLTATPDQIRRSSDVVIEDSRIVDIEEKPAEPRGQWASIMLYAFSLRLLDYLPHVPVSPRGERELVSAIRAGIREGRRVGYAVADWRLHLTHELDLLAINRHYLQEGRDAHILSEIPASVQLIPPVRIDPKVSVGQDARIGPNVYLESGATVGPGAVLRDSVVLGNGVIPAHDTCQGAIVARRTRAVAPELSE
ncbi:MAG: NTP transferase domain-containing protein [Chloroflexi bacterium]|nr:NTP transferase domain-containing protein [Chloroflexota bacterium]